MARFRSDLQAAKSISANTTQPGNEAVRVGNAIKGVAFLNIFTAPTTGSTLTIETATDANLGDGSHWLSVGSTAVGNTSNITLKFALTDLAEVIRWKLTGYAGGTLSFSLVVYLSDV